MKIEPARNPLRRARLAARLELRDLETRTRISPRPNPATDLIRLYLTETLYTLAERTNGRLKRRHLMFALDRAEQLINAAASTSSA